MEKIFKKYTMLNVSRHIVGTDLTVEGDSVHFQLQKISLYSQLISVGDNIVIASNVLFCTHDAIHVVMNRSKRYGKPVLEKTGCIK